MSLSLHNFFSSDIILNLIRYDHLYKNLLLYKMSYYSPKLTYNTHLHIETSSNFISTCKLKLSSGPFLLNDYVLGGQDISLFHLFAFPKCKNGPITLFKKFIYLKISFFIQILHILLFRLKTFDIYIDINFSSFLSWLNGLLDMFFTSRTKISSERLIVHIQKFNVIFYKIINSLKNVTFNEHSFPVIALLLLIFPYIVANTLICSKSSFFYKFIDMQHIGQKFVKFAAYIFDTVIYLIANWAVNKKFTTFGFNKKLDSFHASRALYSFSTMAKISDFIIRFCDDNLKL